MAITPGTRIGAYEVTSQLGEGGMGVVFRARDTKLLRDVAVKVLPDHFADDPERLSRFQREAQILASVNHPNIAQIYGLEHVGSAGCIVMELVEGETLSDRLKNGPIPLDEAIEIAKQIADALAAAHERGIVHRDLKPANIKLTPSGTVKVLDFGLAKALGDRTSDSQLSTLPTKMSGSVAGAVVGTAAYMSPEQARGKEVDARTDIWAFGCVLYEMLTARQTFEGETITDMLAKIVTAQPDLNLLPPSIPSSIRLLLEATLNKNVRQRLQHIGDMRLFLDPKFFPTAAATTAAAVPERKSNRASFLIVALAIVLLAALVPAALYFRSPAAPEVPQMQFDLAIPDVLAPPVVSPDGQRIAYTGRVPEGGSAIWVRSLHTGVAQKLAGLENSLNWIGWSPDNRYIGFIADGKLRKIDAGSGAPLVIADAGPPRGVTWNRQGVILFAKPGDNNIVRVSDTGGTVTPVTTLDANKKETAHLGPIFLPDGNHFIYVVLSSVIENAGFFVGSLDSKSMARLLPLPTQLNGWAYAPPGYLVQSNGPQLNAQLFDAKALKLLGQPFTVADGVESGYFSVSDNGLLLYRKGANAPPLKQLTWRDRAGKPAGLVGAPGNYGNIDISPAGDRIATDSITNNNRDIWVIDVARAVPSRITFDSGADWSPSWSPDGTRLIFASTRAGGTHAYSKSSSGVGNDEIVFKSDSSEVPVSWSHDGKHVVFSRVRSGTETPSYDTWLLDMSGERKASPLIESPFDKLQARISPDGHWIAYATNDSGMYQIVVQSFPDPNIGKWQITAQGGVEPKWRKDGRELYYLGFDGKLMAVPVSSKGDRVFEAGTAVALFESGLSVNRTRPSRDRRYDVAADGRFLIAEPVGTTNTTPVTAVVNWTSGLEKK